jgi:hypothetical protein
MDIQALLKENGITPYKPSKVPSLPLGPSNTSSKPTDRTWGESLSDTLIQLGKGSGTVVRTVGDIAQLVDGSTQQNYVQNLGQDAIDYYDPKLSSAYKAKEAAAKASIAKQNGELAKGVEAIKEYATSPALLGGVIAETLPSLVIGGAIGKTIGTGARVLGAGVNGVTRASMGGAIAAESMLEGGNSGGEVLRQLSGHNDLSDNEKIKRARNTAIASGVLSAATYAIPGSRTVENALMGIDNGMASRGANIIVGGVGEAAQESIQGASSQMAQNYNTDKPIMQGVGEQVGIGILAGGTMGSGAGAVTKTHFASDNILSKVDQHIGTHEANHALILQNDLMKTPDGDTFDPKTDIGFTREAPSVTDHPVDTLPDVDHHAVYNSVIADMLDSARSENAQVYDQARMMAESGASTEQMKSYIDNAFTPTRDDLNIDDLVNSGEPMPSRLSGMRIIDTLERNIAIAINDPMGARTNDQIRSALKKEGVSNEYAAMFTKAYAAKDPTILAEYIDAKTAPLRDEIRALIDERIGTYKSQAQEQRVQKWVNTIPESAQDLVNHPKFTEHLNERADVIASDARYAQTRTADLSLSHENNGQGYETVVQQPAQFDRNYSYDFEMSKKDVADIKAGRWSDELVQKLRNDLDRRDNDPLYNPETPSMRLHREMSDAVGTNQADMNMALINGRAKAMGITPDELIDRSGLSIENMRDMDGAQFISYLEDADRLFQVDMEKRYLSGDRVNIEAIRNDAEILPPRVRTYEEFSKEFNPDHNGDATVISKGDIEVSFNVRGAWEHFKPNKNTHFDSREQFSGAFASTLLDPVAIVKEPHKGRDYVFYKPFKDDNGVYNMAAIKFSNGKFTYFDLQPINKVKDIIKATEGNTLYFKYRRGSGGSNEHTTSQAAVHTSDTEILHQSDTNVKTTLKSINDIVILKDITRFRKALDDGEVDATVDRNQPGWVSDKELRDAKGAIAKSTPHIEGDTRVYEYRNDNGDMFRIIADKEGFRMHSDRAAGDGIESGAYDYTPQNDAARRLNQKLPDVNLTKDQINGMAELGIRDGEMKSVIYLFKTADASTLPHELMHVFEQTLSDTERAAVDDVLKDHAPGTPRKEALARYFEKYLAEGEAPTPELKGVFDKFRDWLTSLWENIIHDGSRDFKLTDAHRELYRALLGDREAAAKLSERYDGIVQEQIRAEAEVLFQRSSTESRSALQKLNNAYDGMIETVDKAITDFARGIDQNGDVIIRTPSEYPIVDKATKMLDWVRESFVTNGRKSDTLVQMAHEFDNVRGHLSDEARALRDLLKGYDKQMMDDPTPNTNLLTQDEAPKQISKGALLVRALGGDLDPALLPSDMVDTYKQMRGVIDANTKALIDAGELAPEHAKENYLKRYYMEHITNKGLGAGKITQSGKHARGELDLDTRLEMGQIEDAAYVITRTMLDQRLQIEKANYFKKMADKFGIDESQDGYVRISKKTADDGKTPLYGALSGKYVPKFVADELNGAYEMGSWVDSLVRGASVPVDFIKVTQTVKNPGTHVYNVGSNTYLAYMDGHLSELAEIAMMIKKDPRKFRAITKAASKQGLNGMGVDLEKSVLKANTDGKAMTIVKNLLLTQDSKGGDYIRQAYDWEDKIFKLAKFYKEMKQNGMKIDDTSAKKYMEEVHKIYVDHSKPVPKFIRNMDKSGISPFLSYAWRSAPQVAYVTLKHPLRFAAMHAVLAPLGASAIWNAINADDDEDQKSIKAQFMDAGGWNMLGIENFYKTGTDENGFDTYANLGRMAPGMRFMPDKGNPLLLYSDGGFAADILGGIFRGENNRGTVYNEHDSNTEKSLKIMAMLSEYLLPPVTAPAVPVIIQNKTGEGGGKQFENDGTVKKEVVSIGGRYAQKLVQALNGKRDSYDQPITLGDVVAQAAGMKLYHVDPDAERERKYEKLLPEIKRAISEGDEERAKELADQINALDISDKKPKNDTKKKEAIKEQKRKMDDQLEEFGIKRTSKHPSLPLGGNMIKPINVAPSLKL